MYLPKHFEITNSDEIFAFVEANAFGQLISQVEHRLFSSHVPFLLSNERTVLFAHLAKANPQLAEIEQQEVLITFDGPHDYISPSWYTGPGVPTWNYQAVHIYGRCKVLNDAEKLKDIVECLTKKYESGFDAPWRPAYKEAMLGAIAGLEIQITEVQCKYKLSQNRQENEQIRIIENLKKTERVKKKGEAYLASIRE